MIPSVTADSLPQVKVTGSRWREVDWKIKGGCSLADNNLGKISSSRVGLLFEGKFKQTYIILWFPPNKNGHYKKGGRFFETNMQNLDEFRIF